MSQPQLSIEEHMRGLPNPDLTIQDLLAADITSFSFGQTSSVTHTCVPFNEFDLIDPQNCDIGKNDLDDYLPKANHSTGESFDPSSFLAIENNLWESFGHYSSKITQPSNQLNPLPLSSSVAVPQQRRDLNIPRPIQIAYELEQDFKARYKTDYYSQDGQIRSPRYVADRHGNHFITLKIRPGLKGYIRIDWITVRTAENKHYSMPYKMQPNSQRPDLPDENPMYQQVSENSSGLMQVYVVLIKYKQDILKQAQPLQEFPPSFESLNKVQPSGTRMPSPKQLIKRFQLDKSQLAFTYCPLAPDGKSYMPDWSTTVISTVMTERSTDSPAKRKITCPNCSHLFDITVDEVDDVQPRKIVKKR